VRSAREQGFDRGGAALQRSVDALVRRALDTLAASPIPPSLIEFLR
jgi:hypothetical protein